MRISPGLRAESDRTPARRARADGEAADCRAARQRKSSGEWRFRCGAYGLPMVSLVAARRSGHLPLPMRLPFLALLVAGLTSCGSRTGLFASVPNDTGDAGLPDALAPIVDGSVPDPDADQFKEDALPPIDVSTPTPINECPDARSTLVYLIAKDGMLMSFYPPTGSFTTIERILCPALPGETPFSMAVDRTGLAYILFSNVDSNRDHPFGELFRTSTKPNSPCQPTRFQSGEQGFAATFGMGFSSDALDAGETLFVAAGSPSQSVLAPSVLASLDTKSYALGVVGNFNPPRYQPELTGTGAGDLFAFYSIPVSPVLPATGSAIGQIDKTTGRITAQSNLPGVIQHDAWAFAFWGGDFYTFTVPVQGGNSSVVTRFRPSDGTVVRVAQSDHLIVGAGVSTCAPQGGTSAAQ